MSDPSSLHKPYTTGALPKTAAAKHNVHMTTSGWMREITATDYAWAGNDNASSDGEGLVAFRGKQKYQGWYDYSFWYTTVFSEASPALIEVWVFFSEAVDINTSGGTPTLTITNNQAGSGSAATFTASYTAGGNTDLTVGRAAFKTGVPSANQYKENDILYIGANALALNSGTIYETGTTNAPHITSASDVGYRGSTNWGGDVDVDGADDPIFGPRVKVDA